MKCDELRIEKACVYGPNEKVYLAEQVNEAIEELKQFAEDACLERDDNQNAIDELQAENVELKQKLEDVQASHYAEMVNAGMRERRLKRALWLARAERAKDRATTCNDFAYLGDTEREINMTLARTWMKCRMLKPSEWSKVWNNVERKFRAKAEEYR